MQAVIEVVEHGQQVLEVGERRRRGRCFPEAPPVVGHDRAYRGHAVGDVLPAPTIGDSGVEQYDGRSVARPALPVEGRVADGNPEGLGRSHPPTLAERTVAVN